MDNTITWNTGDEYARVMIGDKNGPFRNKILQMGMLYPDLVEILNPENFIPPVDENGEYNGGLKFRVLNKGEDNTLYALVSVRCIKPHGLGGCSETLKNLWADKEGEGRKKMMDAVKKGIESQKRINEHANEIIENTREDI